MKYVNMLLSPIPRSLPVGVQAFHKWSDRIISIGGKFADTDSLKFALASMILHLGAQSDKKSDLYFIRSLRKTAANQVAGQIFQDIKIKQQEAAKAASAADTVPPVPVDEQKAVPTT